MWKVNAKGVEVNITPKTLIVNRKSENKNVDSGDKTSKSTFEFLIFEQTSLVLSPTQTK